MSTDARDARDFAEEGFHEIQLSGKQLVFLFMATTVVSIVIFLCGVLVGRGARLDTPGELVGSAALANDSAAAAVETAEPPQALPDAAPAREGQAFSPTELSYHETLSSEKPRNDGLKKPTPTPPAQRQAAAPPPAASTTPAASAPTSTAPAPAPTAAARVPAAETPAAAPRAADGWTVQVAALRERRDADAVVKRLTGRGYDAFVLAPAAGAKSPMYRVRVGSYKDRREAERIMKRLAEEEQFKPWVTR